MQFYFKDRIDLSNKRNLLLFSFLLIWLLVNLIQSTFTELAHDEAYYWMYSRHLAWGYFDHPPMIAVLIKAGYSIFPNELGVRILPSLLGTLSLFIIYQLIDTKGKSLWLFILIVCSVVLTHSHVGGFLAIPDIPVLFFASVFLLLYKNYQEKDNYILAILLGIVAALMLYSKYHGILVLGFTLLANLKLVRRLSFWLIPFICILLFIPHIKWQVENGYPTFVYHLFTRSSAYTFEHTLNYLYSQVLIAGPVVAIIILYQAFTRKAENNFDKVLKVNLIGIFVFFFLSSFKGHVEAHWTAIAYIPLIILAYKGCFEHPKAMLWLQRLFIPSIILFLFIRIILIYDIIPSNISTIKELHNWDKWAGQIDSLAEGREVVFVNSFQRPAKFSFYSQGKEAHSINDIYYRKNQYDVWPVEESLQNKPVLLLHSRSSKDSIKTVVGDVYNYQYIDSFISYSNLIIDIESEKIETFVNDTIRIVARLKNPRSNNIVFQSGDYISATYYSGRKFLKPQRIFNLENVSIPQNDSYELSLIIPTPAEKGKYELYLSISTIYLRPALNAKPLQVMLK